MRRCMNDLYAETEDINRFKEILADCNIDALLEKTIDCIDAMYGELHEITRPSGTKASFDDERRAELARQVQEACTN